MIFGLHLDIARTIVQWWQRCTGKDHRLAVTVLLVLAGPAMFVIGTAYTLAWHEHTNQTRAHALHVRHDLDTLQTLYFRANADFLQGFGSARLGSFAWPVDRVGAAVLCFKHLEVGYSNDPKSAAAVQLLRRETAQWAHLLAEIAVNATLENGRASVDSARLLEANRLLEQIASQLVALRHAQTAILRATSESATRHMEIEGIVLALSALICCGLLGYAFVAQYRTGLARRDLRLRSRALDAIGNGVLITRSGRQGEQIEYANPAFERITGYARGEIVGRDYETLCANRANGALFGQMQKALAKKDDPTTLLQSRRANGELFWNQLHVASVSDERGTASYHISVINELTELIDSRDRLVMQARRDALTDLPNRVTLHELVDQEIHAQRPFALLFMDLDHFKDVNDSLGHGAGDRLLCEVARRLSACVTTDGIVTRYGGDEFVTMLARPHDNQRLAALLERIARAFDAPVQIDDTQLRVQLSIGVACYPDDGANADILLKHADLAMYHVKESGRNGVERFDEKLASAVDQRVMLSRRLRDALEQNAFELAYQPQIDVPARRVCGVEALIRWRDPEIGAVSPAIFIPLAEENGLIEEIGEWVLHTACAQARRWENALPDVRMSVNVSPRQLARDDFCNVVRRALASSGLPGHRLELEITEGALIAPNALKTLRALNEMGVSIAIDDFGTGYSSLSYLRAFHADRLKIDMSFVRGIGVNHADEAIIRAVIALARSLEFQIVAEGVEREDQLAFLMNDGCSIVQGYLFSKPLPSADIPTFVASFEGAEHVALQ
jgi:diguanylate cyclase (GGDEF)-like protein/PAS domain S-box-containing protein